MKALVTGGGGFLGGAIVRQLRNRGDDVVSLSRSRYPALETLGVTSLRGDVADTQAVYKAARGCDIVFHVAAKTGSWGPSHVFHRANVLGTTNVIGACRKHGIRTLVFTSSPSVVFDGSDLEGANESVPYPLDYEAEYPKTKAAAERAVLAANGDELRTVALRPHLIWGPGDTNLGPRIVAKQRAGQLRRLSGPAKRVDVTYIDDAATAHLQAGDALSNPHTTAAVAGKAYFISSGEPVETWTMIDRILAAAGLGPVRRSVSPAAAAVAGWVFETIYGALGLTSEPRMTRWVARELATAHWFDIGAARRDFGYVPQVSLDEGFRRLKAWYDQSKDTGTERLDDTMSSPSSTAQSPGSSDDATSASSHR